jgi:hypothetical protein
MGKPQHRKAPRRSRAVVHGILGTAAAMTAASLIAVAMSGASYALWSVSAPVNSGVVESGSVSLSVSQAFTASSWSNLLVGESVRQSFTVTNTGTEPLTLFGSATTSTSAFEIRASAGSCPATAIGGVAATVSPTALGGLAAGATSTMCVEVTLGPTATPASTSTFVLTLTGVQE